VLPWLARQWRLRQHMQKVMLIGFPAPKPRAPSLEQTRERARER